MTACLLLQSGARAAAGGGAARTSRQRRRRLRCWPPSCRSVNLDFFQNDQRFDSRQVVATGFSLICLKRACGGYQTNHSLIHLSFEFVKNRVGQLVPYRVAAKQH